MPVPFLLTRLFGCNMAGSRRNIVLAILRYTKEILLPIFHVARFNGVLSTVHSRACSQYVFSALDAIRVCGEKCYLRKRVVFNI